MGINFRRKIVSVFIVYLQGMSHQLQINVICAFYNKFRNQFGNHFLNVLGLLLLDGFVNAMLCLWRFPPLCLHKEILNSPCLLILLIHTKHRNKKMNSWTDPTSSFHLSRTHPLGR